MLSQTIERSMLSLKRRSWTIEEYHAMIDTGILTSDDKVELLFGQIIEMRPVGNAHAVCVKQVTKSLYERFLNSSDHVIGVQDPVTLLDNSEPEPDIYVAKGPLERYHNYHPGPAHLLLVVEVADATLHRDKTAKLSAYATAGIQEYWVLDVYNRIIIQYTNPNQLNGVYESENTYAEKDEFESLFLGKFSGRELILQLK